jgi:hypothetical protein
MYRALGLDRPAADNIRPATPKPDSREKNSNLAAPRTDYRRLLRRIASIEFVSDINCFVIAYTSDHLMRDIIPAGEAGFSSFDGLPR